MGDVSRGGLGSFSLVNMIIAHLQDEEKVIGSYPCNVCKTIGHVAQTFLNSHIILQRMLMSLTQENPTLRLTLFSSSMQWSVTCQCCAGRKGRAESRECAVELHASIWTPLQI
jgi:hypothetical protein